MGIRPALGVLMCVLLTGVRALAQDSPADEKKPPPEPGPWDFGTTLGLNLAQSTFTSNWSGGDKSSFNWIARGDLSADRQFTRSFRWDNLLQLAYGQTGRQVADPDNPSERTWEAPDKTTDLIQFESTGRWTLERYLDPYIALRLDSQFADELDPRGTIYFNPNQLKESAGLARVFEKNEEEELISRFGFGFRQSMGRSFADAIGDRLETQWANDGGFEFQTDATQLLFEKRLEYEGKLLVFWPLFFTNSGDLEAFDTAAIAADPGREEVADYWRDPDVNWQNKFTTKVTKWLSFDLYLQFIYNKFDEATKVDSTLPIDAQIASIDSGIRRAGQFGQTLAIGFSYSLF